MAAGKSADRVAVGEEFEPAEFLVTEEFNESYLHAVEDLNPRYTETAAHGPPIVHPALLVNYSNVTRSPSFHLPPGMAAVHTHEELRFFNPARIGAGLQVSWKVTDRYTKRGRPYQVVESAIDQAGAGCILRRISTYTYTGGEYPGADGDA